jgi:hypothetical protein
MIYKAGEIHLHQWIQQQPDFDDFHDSSNTILVSPLADDDVLWQLDIFLARFISGQHSGYEHLHKEMLNSG